LVLLVETTHQTGRRRADVLSTEAFNQVLDPTVGGNVLVYAALF